MTTSQSQSLFLEDVARLILFAHKIEGVYLTGGDLYQDNDWHREYSGTLEAGMPTYRTPHLRHGQHSKRLAIDLNLFVNTVYIRGYHLVWNELGTYWRSLDPMNRWGGDFAKSDYNHFERKG